MNQSFFTFWVTLAENKLTKRLTREISSFSSHREVALQLHHKTLFLVRLSTISGVMEKREIPLNNPYTKLRKNLCCKTKFPNSYVTENVCILINV